MEQKDIERVMAYGGYKHERSRINSGRMIWTNRKKAYQSPDELLESWNFIKSLESKMEKDLGIDTSICCTFGENDCEITYYSKYGSEKHLARGIGTTELEAVLNSIISYLNKKEIK